jgi:hypothetical protein
MGWVGGGAMATWSVWVSCVKVGRASAKSGIVLCVVAVAGSAGPAAGSCAGASVGVMGLMGGRDGDEARDEVLDARRGFAVAPRGVVADAGRPSVAMVRPGMVAAAYVMLGLVSFDAIMPTSSCSLPCCGHGESQAEAEVMGVGGANRPWCRGPALSRKPRAPVSHKGSGSCMFPASTSYCAYLLAMPRPRRARDFFTHDLQWYEPPQKY